MRVETIAMRLAALSLCLLAAGCTEHLANRDTVAAHAGEAVAYNKAVHIIDPWPSYGASIGRSHGGRLEETMTRYRSGAAPSNARSGAAPASTQTIPIIPGITPAPAAQ